MQREINNIGTTVLSTPHDRAVERESPTNGREEETILLQTRICHEMIQTVKHHKKGARKHLVSIMNIATSCENQKTRVRRGQCVSMQILLVERVDLFGEVRPAQSKG